MTNTLKLQAKMKECNYNIKTLANVVGLSTTGLFNKIHNKRQFRVSEMQSIIKALGLTGEEMQVIFFADDVELKSTKRW